VISGSHSAFLVWYAKFPNEYLADIAQHGKHYLERSDSKLTVDLRRTKDYHFLIASERVEFFMLFAKLLWYLISGKCHAGYLYNYEENPLHSLVRPYKSLTLGGGKS
jgi:hypothetical protein